MSRPVKRDYKSELRAVQALQTRRAVVAAAAELFTRCGYGGTTVEAVAETAGVSRKTVFTAVGGKLELLKTALDWAVAGDDEPSALADRDVMRRILAQTDPRLLIENWAGVLVEIDKRVGPLLGVLEAAAGADPAAQKLLQRSHRQRLSGARSIVARLVALNALKPGLTHREAADIAWLATDAVLHDRLVRIRGWSDRRFAKWLAQSLCLQLLDGPCEIALPVSRTPPR